MYGNWDFPLSCTAYKMKLQIGHEVLEACQGSFLKHKLALKFAVIELML